ncbi:protein-methionine-sulfoxide reductase heme-binding subunit MsrQ [Aliiroseovarius sp. S1123]|uniref:protein-methionine-sulfoxide reductase heme-binding subunit MsrQ n=1 Tax=Aliiroseovarius sp. S1123 TaxID=2926404 RepID=UPI001FF55A54|nr:protein-methionine-sulfoxide reductase heme-binding subunit MsrQ [Aliiroseovarius sp. S1123]MCK0170764.1 protein-methionine-sulfoxide reductase heme-binding subunit MsrQ [Aliiroseovarius sp. S1123]
MFVKLADHLNHGLRKVPVWLVYTLGATLPFWYLYLGLTGGLGVEPIKALEHELGELGLQALILGLAVTPLRAITGVNLIRLRRAIGVLTFFYVAAHLLVWLVLDVQILSEIWKDILKRPYITVGMAAFILMTPLAITSNNWSVRKLGPRWRKLHKLIYPTAALGGIHYIMVGKTWEAESLIYMAVILALLGWRVHDSRKKQRSRAIHRGKSAKPA